MRALYSVLLYSVLLALPPLAVHAQEEELESNQDGTDYLSNSELDSLPGMTRRDGQLYYNGERVTGITAVGGNKEESIESIETVKSVEHVRSQDYEEEPVSSIEEELQPLTVAGMKEVKSAVPVEVEEVKSLKPVKVEEIIKLTPLKKVEEVSTIKEVSSKVPVPENVAKKFLKMLDSPDYHHAVDSSESGEQLVKPEKKYNIDYAKAKVQEISEKIKVKKMELERRKKEANKILELLKKMEKAHLLNVQNVREVKYNKEISNLEEVLAKKLLKRKEEIVYMQEVVSKELVTSIQAVQVEEIKKIIPLTQAQQQMLIKMMDGKKTNIY